MVHSEYEELCTPNFQMTAQQIQQAMHTFSVTSRLRHAHIPNKNAAYHVGASENGPLVHVKFIFVIDHGVVLCAQQVYRSVDNHKTVCTALGYWVFTNNRETIISGVFVSAKRH